MVLRDALFGTDVTENVQLLLVFSTHAFFLPASPVETRAFSGSVTIANIDTHQTADSQYSVRHSVVEKYQARAIKQQIDRILWEVWDPIGVNTIAPLDEYSSYVNRIFELLVSPATDDEIATHLYNIASDTMGLGGTTVEAMRLTVAALRTIEIPKNL
jgi:hypothetical protein